MELIQEPVASALASGWKAGDSQRPWLVYDLGGGTFDVSLLETREGLLRVVGHDGDNYLGGRDFDWALVDALLEQISEDRGQRVGRESGADQSALRRMKLAVEDARIELTRSDEAPVTFSSPISLAGEELDEDLLLTREMLEKVGLPLVDRSLEVCLRLLRAHGLAPGQLGRLVLVGGPTWMPFLRRRVAEVLATPFAEHLDPMTLVAQGAALFAATAGVDARAPAEPERFASGRRIWLHHPAMTSDLTPHVVGRVLDPQPSEALTVQLVRDDHGWSSPWLPLDREGAFVTTVQLRSRRLNSFTLAARNGSGEALPLIPASFQLVHGLSMTDPPVSRSVGVALADESVRIYFARGAPLPARRTFRHRTTHALSPGREGSIDIPIVQGEFEMAHLCRLIGSLRIEAERLTTTLPAGAEVELTLELDRGGRLTARALIPSTGEVFDDVVHLVGVDADPASLEASHEALRTRLAEARATAFREGSARQVELLATLDRGLVAVAVDIAAARGGDADAGQRAARSLLELDAELAEIEAARQWPELEAEIADQLSLAASWVGRFGTEPESRLLASAAEALEQARQARRTADVQRHLRVVQRLGTSAYFRHPEAWSWEFEWAESRADEARDLPRARALVQQGRDARARKDGAALRAVVLELKQLLPFDPETRRRTHGSGVR